MVKKLTRISSCETRFSKHSRLLWNLINAAFVLQETVMEMQVLRHSLISLTALQMTWRRAWRSLSRNSRGPFSPSSTPRGRTGSCGCSSTWNMKTWVEKLNLLPVDSLCCVRASGGHVSPFAPCRLLAYLTSSALLPVWRSSLTCEWNVFLF